MPAATMAWAAPAAIGLLGLKQSGDQARKAASLQAQGNQLNTAAAQMQLENGQALQHWAQGYDPASEDARAIAETKPMIQSNISQALKEVSKAFMAGGGMPGLSSEFNVRTQGAVERAADPYRMWMANQVATQADRKGRALQMAAGSAPPGGLGDSFYKSMQITPQVSSQGSLSMLMQALMQAFPHGGGGGAGGTGDQSGQSTMPYGQPPTGTHYEFQNGHWVSVRD